MWAIVEIGKKQYKVKEGDILEVERLKQDNPIILDRVLLWCKNDKIRIGRPYLENIKITAELLGEKKGQKLIIYKYKRRKKYRKKQGHRQIYTRLKISRIVES